MDLEAHCWLDETGTKGCAGHQDKDDVQERMGSLFGAYNLMNFVFWQSFGWLDIWIDNDESEDDLLSTAAKPLNGINYSMPFACLCTHSIIANGTHQVACQLCFPAPIAILRAFLTSWSPHKRCWYIVMMWPIMQSMDHSSSLTLSNHMSIQATLSWCGPRCDSQCLPHKSSIMFLLTYPSMQDQLYEHQAGPQLYPGIIWIRGNRWIGPAWFVSHSSGSNHDLFRVTCMTWGIIWVGSGWAMGCLGGWGGVQI